MNIAIFNEIDTFWKYWRNIQFLIFSFFVCLFVFIRNYLIFFF